MAKKTVATLQKGSNKMTKVFKLEKSKKTGAYIFEERVVPADQVKEILK